MSDDSPSFQLLINCCPCSAPLAEMHWGDSKGFSELGVPNQQGFGQSQSLWKAKHQISPGLIICVSRFSSIAFLTYLSFLYMASWLPRIFLTIPEQDLLFAKNKAKKTTGIEDEIVNFTRLLNCLSFLYFKCWDKAEVTQRLLTRIFIVNVSFFYFYFFKLYSFLSPAI